MPNNLNEERLPRHGLCLKSLVTVLFLLALLILLPAAVGIIAQPARPPQRPALRVGAAVIYRKEEASTHPAPDACDIRPAERGEFYYYSIVRYLRVSEVLGDGRVIAVTPNQQRLCFWPDDSGLRKARWRERLKYELRARA